MPESIDRYTDPIHLAPLAVMGVLLFIVIRRTVGEMEVFGEGTKTPATVCIVLLSLYGFDRVTMGMIVIQYAAMGAAILLGIASVVGKRTKRKISDE